ncbi:hypothetical protein Tco_1553607 [Tanacetum coccineum]
MRFVEEERKEPISGIVRVRDVEEAKTKEEYHIGQKGSLGHGTLRPKEMSIHTTNVTFPHCRPDFRGLFQNLTVPEPQVFMELENHAPPGDFKKKSVRMIVEKRFVCGPKPLKTPRWRRIMIFMLEIYQNCNRCSTYITSWDSVSKVPEMSKNRGLLRLWRGEKRNISRHKYPKTGETAGKEQMLGARGRAFVAWLKNPQ